MSRVNPGKTLKSPVEQYFDWQGGTDAGYMSFYDPEHEDADEKGNVPVMPFYFMYLDHYAKIGGWSEKHKSYLYSNMLDRFDVGKKPFKVYTINDRKLLEEGIWTKDIKPKLTSGQEDAKFGNIVYGYDPKEDRIIAINFFGSGFGAWSDFWDAHEEEIESEYAVGIVDSEFHEGQIDYNAPVFKLFNADQKKIEGAYKAALTVNEYVREYFSTTIEEKENGSSLLDLAETFHEADELAGEWSNLAEQIEEHPDKDQLMMVYKAKGQKLGITLNEDGTVEGREEEEVTAEEDLPF